MIHFPPLITKRLNVQLRELSAREAVDLAATPLERHETAMSALLALIVKSAKGDHSEPGRWTVQERMAVMAHFLAFTSDGGRNFPIGDGVLLDYLQPGDDFPGLVADAGEACGDAWQVKQLTGDEAVCMEAMCRSDFDWITCDMAARLLSAGKTDEAPAPDATDSPGSYSEWLAARKAAFEALPESEFWELRIAYLGGLAKLRHLFDLGFDAVGHVVTAKAKEDGSSSELAPARFPVAACITRVSFFLGARFDRASGLP